MIVCENLVKKYKDAVALDQINVTLQSNKIYGLLGRNGAGKTTLLHLINAEIKETEGRLLVNDQIPYENEQVLRNICFIKESQNFKKNLKVKETLELASYFYPYWDRSFAYELLNVFQLSPSKKVKALSKGMESTLGIIVGLASRAPITIFDEPYIGMDAVAREMFYDILLDDFMKYPRTIILSTHLIDEVSKIFEEVIILDQGKVLLQEEVDLLREKAFYLIGEEETVAALAKNKQVIHSESFGSIQTLGIFGSLTKEERKKAEELNIRIEAIPIQQMMVYLTKKSFKEGKGE